MWYGFPWSVTNRVGSPPVKKTGNGKRQSRERGHERKQSHTSMRDPTRRHQRRHGDGRNRSNRMKREAGPAEVQQPT
jgi:hypothetical protein